MKKESKKDENTKVSKVTEAKEIKSEKGDSIVTSRVLFISVLDKIYLVILGIMLCALTIGNFSGTISSIDYGYWHKVGNEIIIVIIMAIMYLLFNWMYKCAVKTILCLTKNEVYKESYFPLKRVETSIPLNKITGITTHKFFWIFRSITIHQYGKLPLIFFTWNSQEFKDKLDELITTTKEHPTNKYESKNIINNYNILMYIGAILVVIMLLIGIVRFFAYIFSSERGVAGTYIHGSNQIVLKGDGTCNIDDIIERVEDCQWSYKKDTKMVTLNYKYNLYFSTYSSEINLEYDSKHKELMYNNVIFSK